MTLTQNDIQSMAHPFGGAAGANLTAAAEKLYAAFTFALLMAPAAFGLAVIIKIINK